MKKRLFTLALTLVSFIGISQVGINTTNPDPSAALDINAQKGASFGGLKLPAVSNNSERAEIVVSNNDFGLIIYNDASKCIEIYDPDTNTWVAFDNCGSVLNTVVSVNEQLNTYPEDAGDVSLSFDILNPSTTNSIIITVSIVEGYEDVTQTSSVNVVIPANQTSYTISNVFAIFDDSLDEIDEDFTLKISNPSGGQGAITVDASDDEDLFTITDNDPPSSFLFQETFETDGNTLSGGTRYTTSVAEYLSGGDDFFTRINWPSIPSGLSSNQFIDNEEGNFYFGAVDLDSEGGSDLQTLTFITNIDISSITSVDLALLVGEDDANDSNEDWDGGDRFDVQFNIDNAGWVNVFSVRTSSFSGNNHEPAIDSSNGVDGLGEGTRITDTFQEFTKNIPVSGSSMQVRLLFQFQSDDEDIGVDNIRISGN